MRFEANITHSLRLQAPDVFQGSGIQLGVFYKNVDDQFMLAVFCCKVSRLLIVSTLPTHRDSRVKVKLQIPWRLDKFLKLRDIFELRITI